MLSFDENVDSAWIKYLKTLFDHTSNSDIWSIKLRLQDQFKQDWYSLIEHSPKALNYRIFKENFEFENYLSILEDKDFIPYANSELPTINYL